MSNEGLVKVHVSLPNHWMIGGESMCSGIVILATIYIQTCIKPSGAFLCLSFIKNVH